MLTSKRTLNIENSGGIRLLPDNDDIL